MTSSISTYLGYRMYANNIGQSLRTTSTEGTNATATAYYNANIGKVKSVSDFVNNYKLFNYAMTAYGLSDMSYAKAFMTKVLQSNLSDPNSFANKLTDSRYRTFASAFQFLTTGNVASNAAAQTTTQKTDTTTAYGKNSTADSVTQALDTSYYQSHIGSVKTVGDLEKDTSLYNYVMTAYGIDTSTVSQDDVTKALESDLSNPTSFANTTNEAGLKQLASEFNFGSDGSIATQRVIQSASAVSTTVSDYSNVMGFSTTAKAASTDTAAVTAAKQATTYYQNTITKVTSLDQFLSDPKLTSYAIKAYGLPSNTTTAQLRQALTSDPTNTNSAAYKLGTAFVTFAANFNVAANGTFTRDASTTAQNHSQQTNTTINFLWQNMENDAGNNQGTGVQLALYFMQKAPSITNAYQILADKALTQVVQTALGLNSMSSNANIDTQANYMKSRINFQDFQDPKKLERFIGQFAALYDLQNNTSSNPVVQLFQPSS